MIELIGLILPPLIDIINRKVSDKDIRFWVSVGVCSFIGLLINFLTNNYHLGNQDSVAHSILGVFAAAQISFKTVWEGSDMRAKIMPKNQ